jgi:methylated-DNA-protein-cysteine methyltransferase related protein
MIKKKFGNQGSSFSERLVKIALSIPKGKVTTYGRLARAAGGGPMASPSITNILGKAREKGEKNIPSHRIVYADGRVWFDERLKKQRVKQYKEEGVVLDKNNRIVDFWDRLYLDDF